MTWDGFTRAVTFVVGVALVVDGLAPTPPRGLEVAVGLLLMGVFSVDQLRAVVRRRNGNGRPNGCS